MSPAALLEILVTANTGPANAALAKTDAQMKKATGSMTTSSSRMGKAIGTAAKYGAGAVIGIGIASTKMAVDFEDSMEKVHNLVGVSEKQTKRWGDALLKMAPKVGKSPQELADTLYFVSSSGIKASKVLETVKISAEASALGLGDSATVADALTSAMNAYAKSGLSARKATNVLLQTVKFGKLESDELAGSIGRVIPVASKLQVPFQDVGAALAAMSLQGLDAAEATTALRAIFTSTLKPTTDAEKALKSVGLTAADLRNELKTKGTLKTLQDLSTRFHGNEEAMARVFPNVRALVGAFNLTGDSAKHNAEIFKAMGKNTDDLGRAWEHFQKTPAQRMRMAISGIQSMMVKLGEKILPHVATVFADVSDILSDPKLSASEKVAKLGDKLSQAIAQWAPKVAKAGAVVAGALISGLAQAFLKSDTLSRIFLGLGVIRLFGGKGAILKAGAAIGRFLGIGVATGAAAGVEGAAATTGAAAGGAGLGFLGGLKALKWGRIAGIGIGFEVADSVLSGLQERAAKNSDDAAEALKAIADPSKLGKFIQAPVASLLGGDTLGQTQAKSAQKFIENFNARLKQAVRSQDFDALQTLRRSILNKADEMLAAGVSEEAVAKYKKSFLAAVTPPLDAARRLHAGMQFLKQGLGKNLGDILAVFRRNMKLIADSGAGASKTRQMVADNMVATARAIAKGGNVTKEGLEKIHQLIRNAKLIRGEDPFGIAKGFATSWEKAHGINAKNRQRIIDDLGKMPAQARKTAFQTMVAFARQLQDSGKLPKGSVDRLISSIGKKWPALANQAENGTVKMAARVVKVFGVLNKALGGALSTIIGNVNKALQRMGVSKGEKIAVGSFAGLAAGLLEAAGANVPGVQRGGPINLGKASGDSVPAMLERGEYVLNRQAVRAVGKRNLDALNFSAAPRFQKGGAPQMTGPEPLRSMGQAGIDKTWEAAVKFLKAHAPKGSSRGVGAPLAGGLQLYDGVKVAKWIVPELSWARGRGWAGTVASGFRTYAEQAALYARYLAGGNLAAAPGTSEHEFTKYPGGAVDVSDQYRMAGMVPKYTGSQRLKWFGPGDSVHFSGTGHQKGGIVRLQGGGFFTGRTGPKQNDAANRLVGGNWSPDEAASLIHALGGPHPGIFGKITVPESSGNPLAHNSSGATGLWQILGHGDLSAKYGPMTWPIPNAQAAIDLYQGRGNFGDWAASQSGWSGLSAANVIPRISQGIKSILGIGGASASAGDKQKPQMGVETAFPPEWLRQLAQGEFGPMPKNVVLCQKELALRRGQLRHVKDIATDPKNDLKPYGARATAMLKKAQTRLEQRIRALLAKRNSLLKQQQARIRNRIRKFGQLPGFEAAFNAYEGEGGIIAVAQDLFDRLTTLEPEEFATQQAFTAYMGQEIGAAGGIAKSQLGLSNTIARGTVAGADKARTIGLVVKGLRNRLHQKGLTPFERKDVKRRLGDWTRAQSSLSGLLGEWHSRDISLRGAAGPFGILSGAFGAGTVGGTPVGGELLTSTKQLYDLLQRKWEPPADDVAAQQAQVDLLQQLLRQSNQRFAVQSAQTAALLGFPPFGGSFATGGIVPGPAGEPRTVIAHGGEAIGQPGQLEVHLHFADGMSWLRNFVQVELRSASSQGSRRMNLPGKAGRL